MVDPAIIRVIYRHAPIEFASGDEWVLVVDLQDETGAPFDTTNCALQWWLLDPNGFAAFPADVGDGVTVTKIEPLTGGQVEVVVKRTVTVNFSPGYYTDSMHALMEDGSSETRWIGHILVAANTGMPRI